MPVKSHQTFVWPLVFLVLMALTVLFATGIERYEPTGSNLIDPRGWSIYKDARFTVDPDGTTRVTSTNTASTSGIYQTTPVPEPCGLIRLRGQLRSKEIHAGPKSWHRGRFILAFEPVGTPRRGPFHVVARLAGDTPWADHEWATDCPDPTTHVLSARLEFGRVPGLLEARGLGLEPVRQTRTFSLVRGLLMGAWVLALGVLTAVLGKRGSPWTLRWLLLLGLLIAVAVLLPKSATHATLDTLLGADSYARNHLWAGGVPAHLLLFTALGFAVRAHWPRSPAWLSMGLLMQAGVGAECLQILVLDREISTWDVAANLLGVLLGFGAAHLVLGMRRTAIEQARSRGRGS
jgi:hypothetical protein